MEEITQTRHRARRSLTMLVLAGLLTIQFSAAQGWFDTDWIYRSPVTVTNPAGVILPDYQVKITLTSAGAAPNFDFTRTAAGGLDVRITASDGTTELPFIIEDWDLTNDTAIVWTKITSLPASGGEIYVYYGYQGTPVAASWDGDDVFDFYDGFDYEGAGGAATVPDVSKWNRISGSEANTVVDDGVLTMTTGSPYTRLNGRTSLPLLYAGGSTGYIGETRARHPSQGVNGRIMEVGLVAGTDFLQGMRILNDFPDIVNWQYNTQDGNASAVNSMSMEADDAWHIFRIYREQSPLTAGFMVDNYSIENTTDVPIVPVPAMLMSYGANNEFIVDWTRVRKWAGADPVVTVDTRETLSSIKEWNGSTSSAWDVAANWTGGVPTATDVALIQDAANDPEVTTTQACAGVIIEPGGALTIGTAGSLTVSTPVIINSSGTALSGSLINNGTLVATVNYIRHLRPEDQRGERHFFSSPVNNLNVDDFFANNSNLGQVWEYNEVDGLWPDVTTGTYLMSGRGYNLSQSPGSLGRVSFIGDPVNSVDFTATSPYASGYFTRENPEDYNPTDPLLWVDGRTWDDYGGGGWNLMGNPFLSALNVTEFINDNLVNKFDPYYQALYVYDGINDVYKYATKDESGWTEPDYTEGGPHGSIVQAGQGFYVLALCNGVVFNFRPDQQIHAPSVPMLKSAPVQSRWPGLKLKVSSGENVSSTVIMFGNEMTAGNDPGYDLGQLTGSAGINIYTTLVSGKVDVNLARQALPLSGADTLTISVGIDAGSGGEITFSAESVPLGTSRFWLKDKVTGIFTDLTTKSYTVTLPEKTFGTGRFYIIASANTPTGMKLPGQDVSGIRIWANRNTVVVSGEVSDVAGFDIYSLQGKHLLSRKLGGGDLNTVPLPSGFHGLYIVKITDGSRVVSRKLAIL